MRAHALYRERAYLYSGLGRYIFDVVHACVRVYVRTDGRTDVRACLSACMLVCYVKYHLMKANSADIQ